MISAAKDTSYYSSNFFDDLEQGSLGSARAVLPIVFDLLSPRSVLDAGCGRGVWLKAAQELGVERILGLDGRYVDANTLLIPAARFRPTDLSLPFEVPSRYDLALCLEVAEHLPRRAAAGLVESLIAAAPAILFSAAIPGQTGTHHVNEQFPEFWYHLFSERGYVALDLVRPRIAWDPRVEPWYAQNILLYVARSYYAADPALRGYAAVSDPSRLLPWIHAEIWKGRLNPRGCLSLLRLVLTRQLRRG